MKRQIMAANNWSLVCFFLSSASLLGIPFLHTEQEETLPLGAFVLAMFFWGGLLFGIIFQITAAVMQKRSGVKKTRTSHRERLLLIPIALLLTAFVLILCFWKSSLLCMVIVLALLLFSIEIYFYLKRRNRV